MYCCNVGGDLRNDERTIIRAIRKTQEYLVRVMNDVSNAWNDRLTDTRNVSGSPKWIRANVTAALDVTPVYIHRPEDSKYQTATYNGKYSNQLSLVVLLPGV